MNLIRISESDAWIVDYDRERGMYRVSYFEDNHFRDEHWFDCFEEIELSPVEQHMYDYASAYVKGATTFMKYMHDYYNGAEPIYPSEMEGILMEFLQQYGEVKEISK